MRLIEEVFRMSAGILERLREETAPSHEQLESNAYARAIMDQTMTLQQYKQYLELFYGFIKPMEAIVLAAPAAEAWGIDFSRLAKLPLLERDFTELGYSRTDIESIPVCGSLPDVSVPARMLGYLYVMEGSTLGGQVISRKLASGLQLAPESGLSYFYAYGPDTRARWGEMRELLVREGSEPRQGGEMVEAAKETFALLDAWIHARLQEQAV
ncbi:Heme oxygenase [Paenibacillus sp. P22]|nr:Heme oxygenase [Paenibacillus sp. P22]